MTFKTNRCPHCGQSLKGTRYGISLSPCRLKIFDIIAKSSGVSQNDIAERAYPRIPQEQAGKIIRSTIHQINSLFAATDLHIKSHRRLGYRLIKRVSHVD